MAECQRCGGKVPPLKHLCRTCEGERRTIEVEKTGVLCTTCHEKVIPALQDAGSTVTEILLWLCGLIPGLVYSLWRRGQRRRVCPKCGGAEHVPMTSERARKILGDQEWARLKALREQKTTP